jgi:hypothetical protein
MTVKLYSQIKITDKDSKLAEVYITYKIKESSISSNTAPQGRCNYKTSQADLITLTSTDDGPPGCFARSGAAGVLPKDFQGSTQT